MFDFTAAAAKSLQSCLTLRDPIDGSPPGSPVPGILQARTLEWVAISFSNVWKWKVKVKSLSRVWLLATPWTATWYKYCPPNTCTHVHITKTAWDFSVYLLTKNFPFSEFKPPVNEMLDKDHFIIVLIYLSVYQFSRSVVSNSLRPHEPQHARPPCPLPTSQTHVHWVSDAIQPVSPLSSPSPPAFNRSQH